MSELKLQLLKNQFLYKDDWYIKVFPAKPLFRSTMIHEVVGRGDVFAVRIKDQALTIIPGTAQILTLEDYYKQHATFPVNPA